MTLIDARDTPACRTMGRAWWKRFGRRIVPGQWDRKDGYRP